MQGMNRQEDVKFLKQIQTILLKVNIECCNACRKKVKKILEKIDGVFEITIDAEKGKVIVSGDVDAATLIRKLRKAGKHAELLPAKCHGSNYNNNCNINLVNNPHHDEIWKSQKGPLPQHQQQQQQQTKGLRDLKMPQLKNVKIPFRKDTKCVKSTPAPQGWDDGIDDDEDDLDFFDMDLGDDFKRLKTKPTKARSNAGKKGVPSGGGSVNCKKDGGSASGGQKGGGTSTRNGNCRNNDMGGGKNDNVRREHQMMMNPNMMSQGFPPMDATQMGSMQPPRAQTGNINPAAFHGLPAGGTQAGRGGMRPPPPELVGAANMYQHQYMAAMQQKQMQQQQQQQYLAAMQQKQQQQQQYMAATQQKQQQQQYMAAMQQQQQQQLQQEQQQRMMMLMMNRQDGALLPTMLGHPPQETAVQYVPSMPPQGEPYTNMFSEENTSSCSIM